MRGIRFRPPLPRPLPALLPAPLLLLLSLLGCLWCCGPTAKPAVVAPSHADAAPPPARIGKILFACEPGEATVTVDGTPRGSAAKIAAQGGLALPLGLHRFEVTLEGYRTYRLELNLGDRPENIRVQLQPVKKQP